MLANNEHEGIHSQISIAKQACTLISHTSDPISVEPTICGEASLSHFFLLAPLPQFPKPLLRMWLLARAMAQWGCPQGCPPADPRRALTTQLQAAGASGRTGCLRGCPFVPASSSSQAPFPQPTKWPLSLQRWPPSQEQPGLQGCSGSCAQWDPLRAGPFAPCLGSGTQCETEKHPRHHQQKPLRQLCWAHAGQCPVALEAEQRAA